jgi:hypothetical protein
MAPGCEADPVFGTLCDKGGATVSVFVPPGTSKITFDYRFFEWDYVPYEDPFAVTLFNPSNQPVASTGSQNSCEFSNKGGSDLAIGNKRTVEFNVSAYQGQTVKLEFRASDRYDNVLDAGALINNLQVVSGAMSCNGPVCGGCASAAACAAVDADGDGVNSCTDCNDNNPQVKPGASEVCNGQDDNCTGVADEGGVCCVDNDSDGYTGCNGDCNDANAAIKPGAAEVCDGADNDCNGLIDFIGTTPVCAPPDDDGDGVNQNDDCDDSDATVYPGAAEVCDFQDNDCDGVVDEGTCLPTCVTLRDGQNGVSAHGRDALRRLPEQRARPVLRHVDRRLLGRQHQLLDHEVGPLQPPAGRERPRHLGERRRVGRLERLLQHGRRPPRQRELERGDGHVQQLPGQLGREPGRELQRRRPGPPRPRTSPTSRTSGCAARPPTTASCSRRRR